MAKERHLSRGERSSLGLASQRPGAATTLQNSARHTAAAAGSRVRSPRGRVVQGTRAERAGRAQPVAAAAAGAAVAAPRVRAPQRARARALADLARGTHTPPAAAAVAVAVALAERVAGEGTRGVGGTQLAQRGQRGGRTQAAVSVRVRVREGTHCCRQTQPAAAAVVAAAAVRREAAGPRCCARCYRPRGLTAGRHFRRLHAHASL